MKLTCLAVVLSCLLAGCASPMQSFPIAVTASDPGVRIEVNNEDAGIAPTTITIQGDKDRTFHGEGWFIIKALPAKGAKEQHVQIKRFWRGGWFQPEAQIPQRIYFDMSLPTDDDSTLNLNNSK
jgi:hypothetical protein